MSRSIRAILAMLSEEDRETLAIAFEQEIPNKYIIYSPGRFIGVNISDTLTALDVHQRAGFYAEGALRAQSN